MAITVKQEFIKTWAEFAQLATTEFLGRWHFRGVLDNWSLQPSLERAAADWGRGASDGGVPQCDLPDIERRLRREFKRAFPPTASVPAPDEDDDLGWIALMQHHGAPTRLLDWTYSPFVAAFFALDALLTCSETDRMAAIWALSIKPLEDPESLLPDDLKEAYRQYAITREGKYFRAVFLEAKPPVTFAGLVNPYRLSDRLVIQQGVFLCPGNIQLSFEDNLLALPDILDSRNLRKILLPRSVLQDAFEGLRRMNISHATLFPGVDGYARSLRHRLSFLRTKDFFDATK